MTDLTDKHLGEFHLLRKLGSGGMADVYLAEQTSLQRFVAVKVMKPALIQNSGLDMLARFKQEAMMAAGLNHPNIVQVYTIGQEGNINYIAQEYVQGKDLGTILRERGKPDLTSALHVMRQVAAALKASGQAGIVHRDIKPENILVTKKGEVKVADFGLAQLGEAESGVRSNVTMGTPLYMSPEQVSGRELDPRSDVYSLGITYYQILCGETPFQGATPVAIAMEHLKNSPPSLKTKNPALPDVLCRMVHRMMAKRRSLRYQSAAEVLEDLKHLITAHKQSRSLDFVRLPRLEELEKLAQDERAKVLRQGGASPEGFVDDFGLEMLQSVQPPEKPLSNKEQNSDRSSPAARRPANAGPSPKPRPSSRPKKTAGSGSFLPKSKFSINHEELIDMTAMVDIVFFLLIFFLVTSMNGVRASLPMPVPKAADGMGGAGSVVVPEMEELNDSNDDSVAVTIDANDRVRIEGVLVTSREELPSRLKTAKGTSVATPALLISGHGDATHGAMVEVLDAGQEAGFETLRFTIDNSLEE